jgi:hypothetical protein
MVPSTPSGSTLVTQYTPPVVVTEPKFEIGKISWLHANSAVGATLPFKVFSGPD